MRAGMIDMESNTTLVQCYPAHEAVPDGDGPFPPVIVLHGEFGLNAFVTATANRLANNGFYALAPDFYATPVSFAAVAPDFMRASAGTPLDPGRRDLAMMRAASLSDDRALAVLRQALGFLTLRSCVKSGPAALVGFSMGARLVLLGAAAYAEEVRACVAFAPAGTAAGTEKGDAVLVRLRAIRCPVLVFYGGLDLAVPKREREALKARLARPGKQAEVRVFHEAEHDFYVPGLDSFDLSSSRAAWDATLELLRKS